MKKYWKQIFAAALTMPLGLTGCTSAKSPLNSKEPVTLTMWHNFGGTIQETIDSLIDEFNSTIGRDQGIIINVTAISSRSKLAGCAGIST